MIIIVVVTKYVSLKENFKKYSQTYEYMSSSDKIQCI